MTVPGYSELINVEALVVNILEDAGLAGVEVDRITTLPLLMVSAAGGPSLSSDSPGWVQVFDVQLDSWARTRSEARSRIATASHALRTYHRVAPARPQGVLMRAKVPPPNWVPDDDALVDGRPGPRYLTVATVYARPNPE